MTLENEFGGSLANFIAWNMQGGEIWNEALPRLVIVKSSDGNAPRNVAGEPLTFQCIPDGRYITGKKYRIGASFDQMPEGGCAASEFCGYLNDQIGSMSAPQGRSELGRYEQAALM